MSTIMGVMKYDPELRFTPTGKPLCTFTLIAGNNVEWSCEAWEDLGEKIADYQAPDPYQSGTFVIADGYLKRRTFNDRTRSYFVVQSIRIHKET
jgi:single-stranded DNA-binding protein